MFLPLKGGAANNAILEALAAKTIIVTSDLKSSRFYTENNGLFYSVPNEVISILSNLNGINNTIRIDAHRLSWKAIAQNMIDNLYEGYS